MKMRFGMSKPAACLIALAMTAGCASTKVSNRQPVATGDLPRPAQIWVYDFAATPADIPPDSSLANQTGQPGPCGHHAPNRGSDC